MENNLKTTIKGLFVDYLKYMKNVHDYSATPENPHIPDQNQITRFLCENPYTKAEYLKEIYSFERDCEKAMIEILSKLEINAVVKTNPYSLPYKEEIFQTLYGESYVNGMFEFRRVARKILLVLLKRNVRSLRFYIFITLYSEGMGKVEYSFRFTEKSN